MAQPNPKYIQNNPNARVLQAGEKISDVISDIQQRKETLRDTKNVKQALKMKNEKAIAEAKSKVNINGATDKLEDGIKMQKVFVLIQLKDLPYEHSFTVVVVNYQNLANAIITPNGLLGNTNNAKDNYPTQALGTGLNLQRSGLDSIPRNSVSRVWIFETIQEVYDAVEITTFEINSKEKPITNALKLQQKAVEEFNRKYGIEAKKEKLQKEQEVIMKYEQQKAKIIEEAQVKAQAQADKEIQKINEQYRTE